MITGNTLKKGGLQWKYGRAKTIRSKKKKNTERRKEIDEPRTILVGT